ncbi:HYLS1 protein, partial [Baryphthengus martii]|nr:HYLS1 protein [Baryphthengus martii]
DPWQELRWGIRERMFSQPELSDKPQRLRLRSSYVVPTEKKRSALRWEVRWDLAKGLLPRQS